MLKVHELEKGTPIKTWNEVVRKERNARFLDRRGKAHSDDDDDNDDSNSTSLDEK